MVDGIFSILAADSFNVILYLPRSSQKGKRCNQYEIDIAFSRTIYGPFVLDTSFWYIPSFLIDFNCLLTNTMSPVSNFLVRFTLLRISLCLSLLSETRIFNISICINRSGYAVSNLSKVCCLSELPSLDLYGDRYIGNGNYIPIPTTDQSISVPSTGPAFQLYGTKKLVAIIVEGFHFLLILSSGTCSSNDEILNL